MSRAYSSYLRSEHWQDVRERALDRSGYKCSICGSADFLDVHHNTYKHIGNEKDEDVIVLCRECHSVFHGKFCNEDLLDEPNSDGERLYRVVENYFGLLEEGQDY